LKLKRFIVLCLAAAIAGCASSGGSSNASRPGARAAAPSPTSAGQLGSPFSDRSSPLGGVPLILDRSDLQLGTTVEFERLPTPLELHDATLVAGFRRIVIALPAWPESYSELQSLNQMPPEVDCLVVLPGYPQSRQASDAWNLVDARVRIVIVANGPPDNSGVIQDLNLMRGLERVIATMDQPARSGFERLQRPLSFRKLVR
jgi:hypothetical protein